MLYFMISAIFYNDFVVIVDSIHSFVAELSRMLVGRDIAGRFPVQRTRHMDGAIRVQQVGNAKFSLGEHKVRELFIRIYDQEIILETLKAREANSNVLYYSLRPLAGRTSTGSTVSRSDVSVPFMCSSWFGWCVLSLKVILIDL